MYYAFVSIKTADGKTVLEVQPTGDAKVNGVDHTGQPFQIDPTTKENAISVDGHTLVVKPAKDGGIEVFETTTSEVGQPAENDLSKRSVTNVSNVVIQNSEVEARLAKNQRGYKESTVPNSIRSITYPFSIALNVRENEQKLVDSIQSGNPIDTVELRNALYAEAFIIYGWKDWRN